MADQKGFRTLSRSYFYGRTARWSGMFGTSGIRGRVGDEVTAQLGVQLGEAVAEWGAERVVIGRDPRESGTYLSAAVRSGLRQAGTDVIELGLAATPTIARAVSWRNADAGVAVTASHNPPPDNGFKLWLPSGQAFRPDDQAEIEKYLETGVDGTARAWDDVGTREAWSGATDRHARALVDSVTVEGELRVVVDVGNGAGQVTATALGELGCDVITINAQPDGGFPSRPSEPTAAHCADLRAVVPAVDADLGIAHDGDADRMRAVDATGGFLSGDTLLTLFGIASAAAGERVVAPVDTSLAVEDSFAERDIDLVRTRVGDVFVAEGIRKADAVFGGEPSGAWIWPADTLVPDGPLAACKLVELVSDGDPLADRVAVVDRYPIRRETIETAAKAATMDAVRDSVRSRYDTITSIDGVRVATADGWFLIRPSGTESVIRVTAEARRTERADELLEQASEIVREANS